MTELISIIIIIAISIAVILTIREIVLWYFRINQKIDILIDIKDELKKLNNKITHQE